MNNDNIFNGIKKLLYALIAESVCTLMYVICHLKSPTNLKYLNLDTSTGSSKGSELHIVF